MKNNRRDFLKLAGLAGVGVAGTGFATQKNSATEGRPFAIGGPGKHVQLFNMNGYAAPKLDTVRIGFIGLGNRGSEISFMLTKIEGVKFIGLCDLRPEKAQASKKRFNDAGVYPEIYTGHEDEWKKMCDRKDIDVIYIATPWKLHTPMAVYAMNQGKHVCVEVPAARTLDECWQLVETSERTRKHCMMMENCCYGFFELLMLSMVRQGFFGELIHADGAYIHDLLAGNFAKDKYYNLWRLQENIERNGNLYPTHGLGPICQIMNINRGDRMDYMVSLSSNDFMMGDLANKLASTDDFYKPYAGKKFRGNMNTSTIRTIKGRTIMLQHDVTSPRQHVSNYVVSGTKATAQKYPEPGFIFEATNFLPLTPRIWDTSSLHEPVSEKAYKELEDKYNPAIVKKVGEFAKEVGGHGGMDFLMNWRTLDLLRNGLPLDQNVYDAALWSAIGPLSEWSVAHRQTIDVPDFTCGSWETNTPGIDIELKNGGNTKVLSSP
ncbi:MAG TPA: Gfo/Idh/MocA family oxidoreductase [Puia sp.]|nr:Gfo/Idh/MocA family oxidoreductase [Puia sp.]